MTDELVDVDEMLVRSESSGCKPEEGIVSIPRSASVHQTPHTWSLDCDFRRLFRLSAPWSPLAGCVRVVSSLLARLVTDVDPLSVGRLLDAEDRSSEIWSSLTPTSRSIDWRR